MTIVGRAYDEYLTGLSYKEYVDKNMGKLDEWVTQNKPRNKEEQELREAIEAQEIERARSQLRNKPHILRALAADVLAASDTAPKSDYLDERPEPTTRDSYPFGPERNL